MVDEQAKRKPTNPMSLKQIRTINEVLRELRKLFEDTEAEEYLHLAEEPAESEEGKEDNPGTTYGEMALLLSAYDQTITAFQIGRLYYKDEKPQRKDQDKDE